MSARVYDFEAEVRRRNQWVMDDLRQQERRVLEALERRATDRMLRGVKAFLQTIPEPARCGCPKCRL